MKLKLKSNYWEPFHAAFDADGLEFRLMNNEGPNRIEMFHLFKKIGLNTPFFGKYHDFVKINYENERKVVVYDDINMHFGEKKRLCRFFDLEGEDKLKFYSEYIEMSKRLLDDFLSKSTRYLFIGNYVFSYNYFSYNDWRSNNGRVFISNPIRLDVPKWRSQVPYAMFAIDFVGEDNNLKAIDFNCSPGISGVNISLSSTQIVLAIKNWLQEYIKEENNG